MVRPSNPRHRGQESQADYIGSTTASAISAVVAANIVLVGYVVVAFREDAAPSASRAPPTIEDKKAQ
jgi:hypothetical protein